MTRVWHLDDHGIDHRQVGSHGYAIIEEAWVLQLAIFSVDVLLVEGPADTLGDAALVLALHVARMDGPARILNCRIADHGDPAGLWIDLDVGDVRGKARCGASGVDAGITDDGPAGLAGDAGDVFQRHRRMLAGVGPGDRKSTRLNSS